MPTLGEHAKVVSSHALAAVSGGDLQNAHQLRHSFVRSQLSNIRFRVEYLHD